MANVIISRDEAKAQGLKRFFTGIACKHEHVCERHVRDGKCVACVASRTAIRTKRWTKQNPDKVKQHQKKYRETHSEERLKRLRDRRIAPGPYRDAYLGWRAEWRKLNRNKLREQERKLRAANRETYKERAKQLYWKYWEKNRLKNKKYKTAQMQADPEAVRLKARIRSKRYYQDDKNLEKRRSYHRRYYHEKSNKISSIHKRRALKKKSKGSHAPADLAEILKMQKHRCAYCKASLRKNRHLDHIQPLSRGGSNDRANIQYLCVACNLSKHAKDPIEFAQQLGRLL